MTQQKTHIQSFASPQLAATSRIRMCFGLATISLLALLSGCGNKPPECADQVTLATIKELLVNNSMREFQAHPMFGDDPDGWLRKFYDGIKVDVSGIVSDGYKADAKKYLCRATMKITTTTGASLERPIEYSTQKTQDQKDGFLLEVQDFSDVLAAAGREAQSHFRANRWKGTWNGTYACSGLSGAVEGPQGPYESQVSLIGQGTEAKLERVTRGGGVEILTGSFETLLNGPKTFQIKGGGENSPDDRWNTVFVGSVKGNNLLAEGEITLGGQVLRKCQLNLTLGAPMSAQTVAPVVQTPVATGGSAAPVVATSKAPSLCAPDEQIVFACSTGQKLVSLCGSKDLNANAGTLTYRRGVLGQAPEMTYPAGSEAPRNAFKHGVLTYVGGGGVYVTFDKDQYRYVIFSASGKGWTKEGAVVEQAGKRIAHLACQGDTTSILAGNLIDKVGLAVDSRGFDLP